MSEPTRELPLEKLLRVTMMLKGNRTIRLRGEARAEYEALLAVADAAGAVDDGHAYGMASSLGTAETLRVALSTLDSVRRGAASTSGRDAQS